MSALYVRELAAQWAATLATPYHDTINTEAKPATATWCTLEFESFYRVRESYCSTWLEQGTVTLVHIGPTGKGANALLAVAEADAATFAAKTDPALRLTLVQQLPPEVSTADTPHCVVSISFNYEFR